MPIMNSRQEFGSIHKALHWTIVGLVLSTYVTIVITDKFLVRRTPEWRNMLHVHQTAGWLVLFLAIWLMIWRFINVRPEVKHANGYETFAAGAAHTLLFVFLITMPLTGYLGGDRPRNYFGLIDVPSFRSTALFHWISKTFNITFDQFQDPMDFYHKRIAGDWLLWMVVALHVSAALFHHFRRHDRTLINILPRPFSRWMTGPGQAPPNSQ